jgi:hypothetical protein
MGVRVVSVSGRVVVVVEVAVRLIQQWSQRGFVTHWKYLQRISSLVFLRQERKD